MSVELRTQRRIPPAPIAVAGYRTFVTLRDTPLTRREAQDPFELHKTLERVYGGQPDRIHWRVSGNEVIVQSRNRGEWHSLPSGYAERIYERAPDSIEEGQVHRFSLVANPTYKKSRGKRIALITSNEQVLWLSRKAELHGFRVDECRLGPQRTFKQPERRIVLHTVELYGRLTVTDAARFAATLSEGIGRGKAFGCGLLLIRN